MSATKNPSATCKWDDCDRPIRKRDYCEAHYMRLYRRGLITRRTVRERFWEKVDKSGDCWIWRGGDTPKGYGTFKQRGQDGDRGHIASHRFAYEDVVGPIPDGMYLDHKCHNRKCVNPSHLRPATHKQNAENLSGLRVDNTSGYRGVSFHRGTRKWRAAANHNKETYRAGLFNTPEEAAEAARQLRLSLFTHNDADKRPITTT